MKTSLTLLNKIRIAIRVVNGIDNRMTIEEARKLIKRAERMGLLP